MDPIKNLLGLGVQPGELSLLQLLIRGLVVFVAAVVMVRVADKRFLGKMSGLDVILGFILGSALSRAINGSAPFFETIAVCFFLVFVHKFLAWAGFRWQKFGDLIKGCEEPVIIDGKPQAQTMRANHISDRDLAEELRQEGNLLAVEQVKLAFIERSGKISVVPADSK